MSEPGTGSESKIQELIEHFLEQVREKMYVHYAQSYTGNADHHPGIFVCLVSCSDDMARRLKTRIDEIIQEEFAEEGYSVNKPQIH
jgi:hypothetical protein